MRNRRMKIGNQLTIITALSAAGAFITGCAHYGREASYNDIYSPAYSSSSTSSTISSSTAAAPGSQQPANQTLSQATAIPPANSESDRTLITQVRQTLDTNPSFAPFAPNIQVTAQS